MRKDKPILFSAPMVRAILREIEMPGSGKTQTRREIKLPTKTLSGGRIYERKGMGGWAATTTGGPGVFRIGRSGERIAVPEAPAIWHQTTGVCLAMNYAVGDVLWVRETYYQFGHWESVVGAVTRKRKREKWRFVADSSDILFEVPQPHRKGRHAADPATPAWHQRLGRFMPRSASRLTLEVTDVRVERLKDITDADAIAEGIYGHYSDELGRTLYSYDTPGHVGVGGRTSITTRPAGWEKPRSAFGMLWEKVNGSDAWEANPFVVAVTFRPHLMNINAFLKQRELSNVA